MRTNATIIRAASARNAACQPAALPTTVARGTPKANPAEAPAETKASARPVWLGGASRAL